MYGAEKLQELVRHHIALGEWLAEQIKADTRWVYTPYCCKAAKAPLLRKVANRLFGDPVMVLAERRAPQWSQQLRVRFFLVREQCEQCHQANTLWACAVTVTVWGSPSA
jgi:hypothetical protein